jgi:hypothetical protein
MSKSRRLLPLARDVNSGPRHRCGSSPTVSSGGRGSEAGEH